MSLNKLLGDVIRLRDEKAHLEEMIKGTRQALEGAEQKLLDLMTEEKTKSFASTEHHVAVSAAVTMFASVKADRRAMLHEWLEANGHSDSIKESVHAQTLNAIVREWVEQNPDKDLPLFITTIDKQGVRIRRN